MKLNSLRDVFVDCVRDLYSAETQLVKALPRMAKAASSDELKQGFLQHLEETKAQAQRLEALCESLGIKARGKTCLAMKGLIEEGAEIIAEEGEPAAKDAALIVAAQKVEHYEIAGYGSAVTFANLLGEGEAAEALAATLEEEKATDEKLTQLAESGLNEEAAEEDVEEEAPPARNTKKAGGRGRAAAGRR